MTPSIKLKTISTLLSVVILCVLAFFIRHTTGVEAVILFATEIMAVISVFALNLMIFETINSTIRYRSAYENLSASIKRKPLKEMTNEEE